MEGALVSILISLEVATASTLINAVLAIVLAYLLSFYNFWGKELIDTLLTLPLVLPPTVIGYFLLVLVGRNGPLHEVLNALGLELVFTIQGAVVATCIVTLPLALKPARQAFESLDLDYIHMSRMAGLSRLSILMRVILPLSFKGLLAGLMLSFARGMGEFGATLMIAGSIQGQTQTLSTAIYEAVQMGDDRTALILAGITALICTVILLVVKKIR